MSIKVLNKPNLIIGEDGGDDFDNAALYSILTGSNRIVVPNEVGEKAELRADAFAFFSNLETINIKNANIIPISCFHMCSRLKRVEHRNNIYYIKSSAFYGCAKLSNLNNIAKKCFRIEESAFYGCKANESLSFEYPVTIDTGALQGAGITGLKGFRIAVGAFGTLRGCANLEEIDVGYGHYGQSGLENCYLLTKAALSRPHSLPQTAFSRCSSLSSIVNQHLITGIGNIAFAHCSSLSSIFCPFCDGVGYAPFSDCISLKEVTLGHASSFYSSTFRGCVSLESLYLLACASNSSAIIKLADLFAFFNTPMSNSSLLGYYGSIYVPSSWVSIYRTSERWSYFSDRITSLPSEYDSKYVYAYEFYSRSDLTEFPSEKANAEYVLQAAFRQCTSISFVSLSKCKVVGQGAFSQCASIVSVDLPECEQILSSAFRYCSKLANISLPKLKYLGTDAFSSCYSLTSVYLPECEYIEYGAFNSCRNISNFLAPKLKYAEIFVLSDYPKVSYLDFPECIYYGGGGNSYLKSINIPNAIAINVGAIDTSVLSFPKCILFKGASKCTASEIYLENTFSIGAYAFASCANLTKISIPKCFCINAGAFMNCTNLSKVNLQKAEVIGDGLFKGCINLRKILLPYANNISSDTFYSCNRLESLYLFRDAVVSCSTYSSYNEHIFDYSPITDSSYLGYYGSIYVPASLVSFYQQDSGWLPYSDRFVGLTDTQIQNIIENFDNE